MGTLFVSERMLADIAQDTLPFLGATDRRALAEAVLAPKPPEEARWQFVYPTGDIYAGRRLE